MHELLKILNYEVDDLGQLSQNQITKNEILMLLAGPLYMIDIDIISFNKGPHQNQDKPYFTGLDLTTAFDKKSTAETFIEIEGKFYFLVNKNVTKYLKNSLEKNYGASILDPKFNRLEVSLINYFIAPDTS